MPQIMQSLIEQYIAEIKKIYGAHLRKVILYGSYARGDFRSDSDVDIMILFDISDVELKAYSQQLSYMTYDSRIVFKKQEYYPCSLNFFNLLSSSR